MLFLQHLDSFKKACRGISVYKNKPGMLHTSQSDRTRQNLIMSVWMTYDCICMWITCPPLSCLNDANCTTANGEVGGEAVLKASPDSQRNIFRLNTILWHRRQTRHFAFFGRNWAKGYILRLRPWGCINICRAHVWLHRGLEKPISLHAWFLASRHRDRPRCSVHSYCTLRRMYKSRLYAGRLLQSVKSRTPTWDYGMRAVNQL